MPAGSGLIEVWVDAGDPGALDAPTPGDTGEPAGGVGLLEGVAADGAGAAVGVAAGIAAGTGGPIGAVEEDAGAGVFCTEAGPDEVADVAESDPGLFW
jgi:hypothetical protein